VELLLSGVGTGSENGIGNYNNKNSEEHNQDRKPVINNWIITLIYVPIVQKLTYTIQC
jgi:hypothetical protein